MRVDVTPALPGNLLDAAWDFYRDTFDELRVLAVNRRPAPELVRRGQRTS